MIIDGHVRIGSSFNKTGLSIDEYVSHMESNNITKAVICPNKPISYLVEDGNALIAEICQKDPDKFIGAIRLDPWRLEASIGEIEKYSNIMDKFLYLNPFEELFQCNDEILNPLLEMAEKLNYIVIVETGYPWHSHITQVVDIARRFPNLKFFATNAGQLDLSASTLDDVAVAMDKTPNLYLGTASACGAEWIKNIADKYSSRVYFESNFPMMDPYLEIFRVTEGFFTKEQQEDVLYNNMNTLINK